ncbi:hypothetical protein E2C01_080827 [Portunus trituberculatus]|uniref:Uncharacterized protein n=1 Tax=Portunus trituberculatus TaxID=210409 RepID=A0A5B7IU74_PORTR|nr:hypothetical protein [Portunus trituberculatus]
MTSASRREKQRFVFRGKISFPASYITAALAFPAQPHHTTPHHTIVLPVIAPCYCFMRLTVPLTKSIIM